MSTPVSIKLFSNKILYKCKNNLRVMLLDPAEKWKFINVLSLLFITMTFCYDICLFFINFPDKNRDIIVGVANIINSGGLITILNYFYGSSKSADGKDRVITSLVNNQGNNSDNTNPGTIIVNPIVPPTDPSVEEITTTTTIAPSI